MGLIKNRQATTNFCLVVQILKIALVLALIQLIVWRVLRKWKVFILMLHYVLCLLKPRPSVSVGRSVGLSVIIS